MGFFSRLFGGGGDDSKRIREMADDVERYADRFANARDKKRAARASHFADRIRQATTFKSAKIIHAEFLAFLAAVTEDTQADQRVMQHRDEHYTQDDTEIETYSDDS